MNQPPGGASGPAPLLTNGVSDPPAKRVVKPAPSLFKKVNNKRQAIGTKQIAQKEIPSNSSKPTRIPTPPLDAAPHETISGFSDPKVLSENIKYTDYKLVTTKRELLQGLRYHLIQFTHDDPIDIRDGEHFQKPAHLSRRNPRPKDADNIKEENLEPQDGLTAEQREVMNTAKEIRQKQREENLAQVAPSQSHARKAANKKKTAQHYQSNLTDEQKIKMRNNYEEKFPWVLEDWSGKTVFVGEAQTGPTRKNAAFAFDASTGKYRVIPVEKVYSFEPRKEEVEYREGLGKTVEEVDAIMAGRARLPSVISRYDDARHVEQKRKLEAQQSRGLFTGGHQRMAGGRGGEDADLDFDEDFADDEEGDLFNDPDEDEKIAQRKIKEDQLQANFLDFKDVRDYEVLEEQERREEEAKRRDFKEIRKALAKREGNYNQGSDSDDDSSSDTDEERQRLEAEKRAQVKKEEDAADGKASRVPSGANTPSGRKEKGTGSDREQKRKKRPGSPNLSDASGTDASVARKKKKTKHISSSQPTPGPSRPMSPDNANLDPSSAANRPIARSASMTSNAAGSDTDAGVMSDGGTKRSGIKLKMSRTSPPTSRPPSPPPQAKQPTTAEEFRALIPPEGISTKDLMHKAGLDRERMQVLMPIIRTVTRLDPTTRKLVHKTPPPANVNGAQIKKETTPTPGVKKEGD